MKRRQYLDLTRPKDTREIVTVEGVTLTCDEFQVGAATRMARFDALPPAFRALCHDFNVHAGDLAQLLERGVSAEEARRRIERKVRR